MKPFAFFAPLIVALLALVWLHGCYLPAQHVPLTTGTPTSGEEPAFVQHGDHIYRGPAATHIPLFEYGSRLARV